MLLRKVNANIEHFISADSSVVVLVKPLSQCPKHLSAISASQHWDQSQFMNPCFLSVNGTAPNQPHFHYHTAPPLLTWLSQTLIPPDKTFKSCVMLQLAKQHLSLTSCHWGGGTFIQMDLDSKLNAFLYESWGEVELVTLRVQQAAMRLQSWNTGTKV